MTLVHKTRLVVALLVLFALWPLAHHLVAKRYFVSPWRLFGWAMYCVPIYKPLVQSFVERGDDVVEVPFPRERPDDQRAFEQFAHRRSELGMLEAPNELGRILLEHHPEVDRVIIKITQPVYHYDSDSIRQAYFEHTFERAPASP